MVFVTLLVASTLDKNSYGGCVQCMYAACALLCHRGTQSTLLLLVGVSSDANVLTASTSQY
jgi:hypothetical protein